MTHIMNSDYLHRSNFRFNMSNTWSCFVTRKYSKCDFECFDASVFDQLQHFKVLLLLSWLLFDVLFMEGEKCILHCTKD